MIRPKRTLKVIVAAVIAALPSAAGATPATWDGDTAVGNIGDGVNWSDPNNWTTNGVVDALPTTTSPYNDITFSSGSVGTISLNGNQGVNNLTFNANFTLDPVGTTDALTFSSGTVTIANGVAATINSNYSVSTTLSVAGGGTLTLGGKELASTVFGTSIASGNVLIVNHDAALPAGSIFTSANARLDLNVPYTTFPSLGSNQGTVNFNQSATIGRVTNTGTINIASNATLTVTPGTLFSQTAGTLNVTGKLALASNTFNFTGGIVSGEITIAGSSTLAFGTATSLGGTFDLLGTTQPNQPSTSTITGSQVPSNTTVNYTPGTATGSPQTFLFSLPLSFTNSGVISLSPHGLDHTINVLTGTHANSGALINSGTFNVNAGPSGGGNPTLQTSFNNPGTLNINTSCSISGLNNTGNIHINAGTTSVTIFSQSAGTLDINGIFNMNGGCLFDTGGTIHGRMELGTSAILQVGANAQGGTFAFVADDTALAPKTIFPSNIKSDMTVLVQPKSMVNPSGTPTFTIALQGGSPYINNGVFSSPGGSNRTVIISSTTFSNSGTFSCAGSTQFTSPFLNSQSATFAGQQSWAAGITFSNTAGVASFQSDIGGPSGAYNLTVAGSGGEIDFSSTQHLAALSLSGSATAKMANPTSGHFVLVSKGLTFDGLSGAWAGKLDLQSNDMIVRSTAGFATIALANITNQLHTGLWIGTGGIFSSTAHGLTTLGSMLNAKQDGTTPVYASFDGQTSLTANDVLVKSTYFGDADLSGLVTGNDYTLIDNGFNTHSTGWQNGDFNYDGVVDGSDYTLIDNAFNTQGVVISAKTMSAVASAETVSVPEPGHLFIGIAALAGLAGLRNPRRLRR